MNPKKGLMCCLAIFLLIMFSQAAKAMGGRGSRQRKRVLANPTPVAAPVAGKVFNQTLQSGGLTRSYIVYVPVSYDGNQAAPLMIALHGGGGQASGMNKLTDLNEVADEEGFLIAYPDGIRKSWADGRETRAESKG